MRYHIVKVKKYPPGIFPAFLSLYQGMLFFQGLTDFIRYCPGPDPGRCCKDNKIITEITGLAPARKCRCLGGIRLRHIQDF